MFKCGVIDVGKAVSRAGAVPHATMSVVTWQSNFLVARNTSFLLHPAPWMALLIKSGCRAIH